MSTTTDLVVKRAVKVPHLKLEEGVSYDIEFTDTMKEVPAPGKFDNDTMTVVSIVLLATGEAFEIIVAAVLKKLLEDEDGYVGRPYRIEVGPMADSGKYRHYFLYELESGTG